MQFRPAQDGNRRRLISRYASDLGNAVHRHKADVALRAASAEAEMAYRARAAFIANMSHELRTPLNAIIGFSDVLKTSEPGALSNDQTREFCQFINGSALELLKMINRLLELTKIQSGSITINSDEIDLCEITDACFSELAGTARQKGIQFSRSCDGEAGLAFADQAKTRQILLSVIDNAVKFSSPGGPVHVAISDVPHGHVQVVVADKGTGMSEQDIELALSKFGQIDSGLDRRHNGGGLGLPIAKALIELQDGSLTISSIKERGTEVTLTLPRTSSREN